MTLSLICVLVYAVPRVGQLNAVVNCFQCNFFLDCHLSVVVNSNG